MALNARKHTIPAESDTSVSRETIFETFGNSINDIVPVANVLDRSLVVSALTGSGQGPTLERPLVVFRADAPGLHRIEHTTDGTTWLPGTGVLRFDTKPDAASWAASNGGLLVAGDRAIVGNQDARWSGTEWHVDGDAVNPVLGPGWRDVAMNRLSRWSGQASYTFNAFRDTNAGVGAVIATIPPGYRGAEIVFTQAWGLAGAPNTIQARYNPATDQVLLNQGLPAGQAIALSIMWSARG